MKKLSLSLSIVIAVSFSTFSQQDPNFTTDGFVPFWNNPAATGSINKLSANAIYRNQWPALAGSFKTYGFTVEADTKFGSKSAYKQVNLPVGINAIFERWGEQSIQTINLPVSIPFKIKNSILAAGLSVGIKRFSSPMAGTVIGGNSFLDNGTALNLNAGVFWSGERYYIGASATNLGITENSDLPLFQNYNFQAGYQFKVGKHYIFPMLSGTSANGFNAVRAITYFQFKEDVFSLGLGLTPRDSYLLAATIRVKSFKLAYVYDLTTSQLSNASGGSSEFRLSYAIAKTK